MSTEEQDPLMPEDAGEKNGTFSTKSRFTPRSVFLDHFSLESPSDGVQFRNHAIRVFSSGTEQFQVVEEKEDDNESVLNEGKDKLRLKARTSSDGSSGLSMLRAAYSLVAVLMMGFLLIFALQVILFLFVSLVTEGGLTSNQSLNYPHVFGTILSTPVFVYGLASSLTMATEFVADTWRGHSFLRTIVDASVFIDWYSFITFFGVPLSVMLYQMFTGDISSSDSNWWQYTAFAWFVSISLAYCIFCFAVFCMEVWGALELLSHHPNFPMVDVTLLNMGKLLKRAILLRQLQQYSGQVHRTFYIEGADTLPNNNESISDENADDEFVQETYSWYSRLMVKYAEADNGSGKQFFIEYDTPKRQFNVEDVLDRTVFVTDSTWNLEKFYCRRSRARTVMVVNGPSRIKQSQMFSSVACAVLGNILSIVFVAALLRWGGASIPVLAILTALYVAFNWNAWIRIYSLYDSYRDTLRKNANNVTDDSQVIYQVTETHRLTHPTEKTCWIMFVAEIWFFFAFPLWMLYDIGNHAIAYLFIILGVFSACRYYFNAPVVLTELGSLDLLDPEFIRTKAAVDEQDQRAVALASEEDWRAKNTLSKIVGHVSQGSRRDTWVSIIFTFVMIFLFLFLSAFAAGSNTGAEQHTDNILKDFRYVPKNGTFQYPTCVMTADFAIPTIDGASSETTLADYAYIASIAYTAPESMPNVLAAWFGDDLVVDNVDLVNEFRSTLEEDSAVHFKLLTFPTANPDFAVVTIRGTNNGWDMISDAQLWSAAYLSQAVRSIVPLGEVWNPILETLVGIIGLLQDASLRKVAFYTSTSGFVNWLRDEKKLFPKLRVTGHSLGGGLAMITGAQTHTPAIGLSGPNTIITRKTLTPPVTLDELNSYTFNIMPDRDPVAVIDDPAKNVQKIACTAASNNFVDCHTSTRSLCEIQYTCGSGPRPTLCDCAVQFGYPTPEAVGDRTFEEACGVKT